MTHWTAELFASAMKALASKPKGEGSFGTTVMSVARYPIKAIAAFLTAPILAFRVARAAKNPVRRLVARVGLFLSLLLAWLAGTTLGTAAGALLIMSKMGIFWGIAFFVGTFLSVTLSVVFSILVFNAAALFFLRMSSAEVVEYLQSLSE